MNDHFLALLYEVALLFPTLLIVFTFRGFFKAFITLLLGDHTAAQSGFLTLNPLVHLDVYGLFAWICLIYLVGGLLFEGFVSGMLLLFIIAMSIRWMYQVPVHEENFHFKTVGRVIAILSGPCGIFLLALIGMYALAYFPASFVRPPIYRAFSELFSRIVQISIWFGVLDLLPLPPFDAGRLLPFIVPLSYHFVLEWLEEYAIFIFLGLFFLPGIRDVFLNFLFMVHTLVAQGLFSLVV